MPNFTTDAAGTVLTIPANSIWEGHISLSATLSVSPGGSANTQYPSIDVSGTGGTWDDGHKVIALALSVPAISPTALTGAATTGSISTGQLRIQSRSNPLSFVLNYGAGTNAIGLACGEFI